MRSKSTPSSNSETFEEGVLYIELDRFGKACQEGTQIFHKVDYYNKKNKEAAYITSNHTINVLKAKISLIMVRLKHTQRGQQELHDN